MFPLRGRLRCTQRNAHGAGTATVDDSNMHNAQAPSAGRKDNSLGTGVYYADADYVGVLRRIGILIVDGLVLFVVAVVISAGISAFVPDAEKAIFVAIAVAAWIYTAVLKPSRIRTVGYRLMGCKIVTLGGGKPSPLRLTFRALLWILGPLNLLYDLAWCGIDDQKQTLRDRFAGTTVVNSQAEPAGTGPIHLSRFSAMGYAFVFPRVMRQPAIGTLENPPEA
jgi:uncharacterized RDD family membrane protein YckC